MMTMISGTGMAGSRPAYGLAVYDDCYDDHDDHDLIIDANDKNTK